MLHVYVIRERGGENAREEIGLHQAPPSTTFASNYLKCMLFLRVWYGKWVEWFKDFSDDGDRFSKNVTLF